MRMSSFFANDETSVIDPWLYASQQRVGAMNDLVQKDLQNLDESRLVQESR